MKLDYHVGRACLHQKVRLEHTLYYLDLKSTSA